MVANDSNDETKSFVALTVGTQVSHYRIVEKIGAGGMGEVYLAEDTELKRQVALKFLPPHLCHDEDCRARFKREAQAAAKLDHSNIVPVYEVGEFKGRPFFAMAHIEGQSLREVIKQGKLTVNEAVDLTMQVCEGLYEAHSAGVVHRDIKPGNIIIDKKGKPRLLDFGLATVSGEEKLTKTGSTLGTVGYMSPEQVEGKKVDHRSDLFSVGVILYEMITGRRPFAGDNDAAVVKAISSSTPEPIARFKSGVTGELQSIIDKALSKDVSIRYQHADGMLADLKRLAASSQVPVTVSTRERRPKKLRWAAALSLLIIAVVSIGFVLKHFLAPGDLRVKSLAVLFFENLGTEDENYLASGLAEDLAMKLRNIAGFQVASSADIRRLSKKDLLAKDVASHLGVQYALDGSLLRHGERIRVNVELIDEKTGEVIWSEQFNREFTEVFQFIDEISRKIAQALEVHLIPAEQLALKEKPTDDAEAYDHYLKGRHYYYNITFRDNDLAEREFERALQLDPDYPLALAGLADVYVQRYKERFDYDEYWLDSSDVLIDRALALDSDLAEAYESRAEVLLQKDNITGAFKAAEKARDLQPEWDEPYIHLGNIYKQRGERSKALAMFDTALSFRPSVDAWCGRGSIFQIRGQMDSAKAVYLAATELNPDHDRPYLELGGLYEELHEGEKAETMYHRAIEVRPDHAAGYQQLSWRMYNRGSVQEAEKLLRGFVERFPYNWDGYDALYDYVVWWRGDYQDAIKIVEEAVSRNPKRVWPHLLLASTYAWRMSPEEESDKAVPVSEKAVQAVEQALALRPNSGRVLEWAGAVYFDLHRLDEAMAYYNRAIELRPGSSELLSSIWRNLNNAAEHEKALEFAHEAVKKSPGIWSYYNRLRRSLEKLNREEEFLDIIQEAARQYGDDPLLLQLLSCEQCLTGQFKEAISTCQRALTLKKTGLGGLSTLGLALWLSGDEDGALDKLTQEKDSYTAARLIVAILKSQGRFREIEEYLKSVKEGTAGQAVGMENWAYLAGSYYESMRRFDDALAVYSEFRGSGEETYPVYKTMAMATCYMQKGAIDRAKDLLEELIRTSTPDERPNVLAQLALLRAIDTQDLGVALKLAEQAHSEKIYTWAFEVIGPLLCLQYATGQTSNIIKTLAKTESVTYYAHNSYLKAQIAAAIGSSDAAKYLEHSVSNLTRLSRSQWELGSASAYLALALARAGKPREAQQEIKRALKLEPERAGIAYNATCAYSLMADTALALHWLETAVERGYLELWWARVDPDLDPLRELPRFKEIMNDWESRIQALLE